MDKKNDPKYEGRTSAKPHYYGAFDGVHVFHAMDEDHDKLVGHHVHSPTDQEFKSAIDQAKSKKVSAIVVHGTPPQSLLGKINQFKASDKPEVMMKSVDAIYVDDLKKAYLHNDQQSRTDLIGHTTSLNSANPDLMKWGQDHLVHLKKDELANLALAGKTIKVRKYDRDLYNGWVEESNGNRIHTFERVTLPELITQLQSKLELYGIEADVTGAKPQSPVEIDPHEFYKQIHSLVTGHLAQFGETLPDDLTLDLSDKKPSTEARLKKLRDEVRGSRLIEQPVQSPTMGNKVEVPKKDLVGGMLNPEMHCEDCGSNASFCDCYAGLSKPEIHLDLKQGKLTILFKSEWDDESKESFVDDLKRRAGQILKTKMRTQD